MSLLQAVAAAAPDAIKLVELEQASGLHRATAHRLLASLAAEGLVELCEHGYVVGPACWLLGLSAQRRFDISEIVAPSVRRVAEETGDVAYFSVRVGHQTRCISRAEGDFPILPSSVRKGSLRPIGVGAQGVAMLAVLEDTEITALMQATLAERTGLFAVCTDSFLWAKIAEARAQGYAQAEGEIHAGWGGYSMPVRSRWGTISGALSYNGISERLTPERTSQALRLLREEADIIEAMLGRHKP